MGGGVPGEPRRVRFDQVVRDDLGEAAEPEVRELREDLPLVRDAGREHAVEGGDAVGRDEEEAVAEVVDVAHLSAARRREPRQGSLEHGFGHAPDSRAGTTGGALDFAVAETEEGILLKISIRSRKGGARADAWVTFAVGASPKEALATLPAAVRARAAAAAPAQPAAEGAVFTVPLGGAPAARLYVFGGGKNRRNQPAQGAGDPAHRREDPEPQRRAVRDPRLPVHAQADGRRRDARVPAARPRARGLLVPRLQDEGPREEDARVRVRLAVGRLRRRDGRGGRGTPRPSRGSARSCATSGTRRRTTSSRATSRGASPRRRAPAA